MKERLGNGKEIVIDAGAVFRHPRVDGLEYLRELKRRKEARMAKDLGDYTDDELYAELDRIGVEKARLGRRRDQYTDHTRQQWIDRRKRVAGLLRQRGLPVKRPASQKILGTAAHLAAQRREAAA